LLTFKFSRCLQKMEYVANVGFMQSVMTERSKVFVAPLARLTEL
jgi:hypothetical protein